MTIAIRDNDDDRQAAVIDAEIVKAEDPPARPRRIVDATALARRQTVHVVTTARTVATHDHTKTAARHLWFPIAGAGVVARSGATRTAPTATSG